MKIILTLFLFLSLSHYSFSRALNWMTFEDMQKKADLIVIVRPIAQKETDERKKLNDLSSSTNDLGLVVMGVETTFKCLCIFKGKLVNIKNTFVLHHYKLQNLTSPIMNGPCFIEFEIKKDSRKTFLMFLKKEKDGRYAPVTGQQDPKGNAII